MIFALALAAAQPTIPVPPEMQAKLQHASVFVWPVLRDLVSAIQQKDELKFARHVKPGALLIDADGNAFPLRIAALQSLSSDCTFRAMAYNSDALFDDGITFWNCPAGPSQLHFKMQQGKVISASPFRDPATERSKRKRGGTF